MTSRARLAAATALAMLVVIGIAHAQELALGALRGPIARTYPEVPFITADALDRALRGPVANRPRLIDARTPAEFAVSHLFGAVRVDPDRPDVGALGGDHARPVVVYCAVGYRSAAVARVLKRAGFRAVSNLEEGIFGWANRDLPVYRGNVRVRDVHPFDDTWGRMLRADLRTRTPR